MGRHGAPITLPHPECPVHGDPNRYFAYGLHAVPDWWLGRLLCRWGWHRWRTFITLYPDGSSRTRRECRRRARGRKWKCEVHERYRVGTDGRVESYQRSESPPTTGGVDMSGPLGFIPEEFRRHPDIYLDGKRLDQGSYQTEELSGGRLKVTLEDGRSGLVTTEGDNLLTCRFVLHLME